MLRTELTRRWGLEVPIVQAPMAGVSGGALAGAVSAAGGLGMVPVGPTTGPDWLAEQAALARRSGKFGVGLLLWAVEAHPEQFDNALAERPFLLSLSFGDPTPYVARCHDAGVLAVAQVQTVAMAERAVEAGVDAVVVQGTEAGGHTGSVGTLPLLEAVLHRLSSDVLVLAAGGIATGRGVAAALAMGASGAWIGTRFVATDEALSPQAAKQAIVGAAETETLLTHVFDVVQDVPWPDQFPGRALRNAFGDRWHGRAEELASSLPDARREFEAARAAGDLRVAHVYAGQAAGAIDDVVPAAELVRRLVTDAERCLTRASSLVD